MAYVEEVLRNESDGKISFGNHSLPAKTKVENFKSGNDLIKVKTFCEMTRLEKNDMFVYESEPGTSIFDFKETDEGVTFKVFGDENAQITVGLKEDTEYNVFVGDNNIGKMKTNLSGKLSVSVELSNDKAVEVKIVK